MDGKSLDIKQEKIEGQPLNQGDFSFSINTEKPKMVITLDRIFKNNDQLKTNTALQMKDADIEFKVV